MLLLRSFMALLGLQVRRPLVATRPRPLTGGLGYCMFGNTVSEEFSQNLFATPGYNGLLNKVALYALIITPM